MYYVCADPPHGGLDIEWILGHIVALIMTSSVKSCCALLSVWYVFTASCNQTDWQTESDCTTKKCPPLDNASTALCSTPFLYWNLNYNPISLVLAFFCNSVDNAWSSRWHKLLWSVFITKGPLCRYDLHLSTAIIIARNFFFHKWTISCY